MKNILILLLISISSFGQERPDTKLLVLYGDTLWIKNVTLNDSTQVNKLPSTGGGNTITILANDVINSNAVANTIADVTGLSFAVIAGNTYKFKFSVVYTAAATTTGSRWSINGPATTFLHYYSNYTLTATSITNNQGLNGYNLPAASNASSITASNIAIIEGIIKPSANGTVICRFASEVLSSAITAKGGMSYVEYKQLN